MNPLRLTILLALSSLIHLAVYQGAWLVATRTPSARHDPITIEVRKPSEERKSRLVVDALPDLRSLTPDLTKPAEYLSDETRRVEKETRALKWGKTENRKAKKMAPQIPYTPGEGLGSRRESAGREMITMEPATDMYLPGVQAGAMTALNTDQFKYHSFFSRIKERVRPLWLSRVRSHLTALSNEERQVWKEQKEFITEFQVILDSTGKFEEAILHRSSGLSHLDQAAIQGFADAEYFPNPPQGMRDPDGKFRLNYTIALFK
ncbi:MAG: energy transducer TonB [Oligoflexia bacterium]|nr:energy transducer TonB [Oligoflexia bacterium]